MKKNNFKSSLIIFVTLLLVIIIAAVMDKGISAVAGWSLIITIVVIASTAGIIATVIAGKKAKELAEGLPKSDEMSNLIKYKSGYYAYMASMYMWLLLFIFKRYFPDVETIIGGGVLLSAVIYAISRFIVKKKINE